MSSMSVPFISYWPKSEFYWLGALEPVIKSQTGDRHTTHLGDMIFCSICLQNLLSGTDISFVQKEKFEDTKGVVKSSKSTDRQHNGQKNFYCS
jgi:hypothetical protein